MQVLWAASTELTGREVASELPAYAYTTLATVLDRLSNKGLVRRRWEGRARRYWPTASKSEHTATLMHEVLRDSNEPVATLAALVASMSADERDALHCALQVPPASMPNGVSPWPSPHRVA